jgi:hypothetical protein
MLLAMGYRAVYPKEGVSFCDQNLEHVIKHGGLLLTQPESTGKTAKIPEFPVHPGLIEP